MNWLQKRNIESGTYKILLSIIIVFASGFLSGENSNSKLKFSFSERFRFVGWENAINLNDESSDEFSFTRHRTSLGAVWTPGTNLELGIKLTNEFRYYLNPKHRNFNMHEIVFDQLYVKWKNVGNSPLTLTLGRQNIILGEGFVVLEGHPLDGSRTIYFNAIRADYQFSKQHKLTTFFSYQPTTDDILPVINDRDQGLIDKPTYGFGMYYTGKLNRTGLEAYYIYKKEDSDFHPTLDANISTIGARVNQPLMSQLSLTAEFAYQFGTYEDDDMAAYGGYFHLDYLFKKSVPLLKKLTLGGILLSGDNANTDKYEGWDPVFSRWPKWSESYIYTLIRENGVAYWSNLNSVYLSLLMDLTKGVDLNLTYHRLGANRESGLLGSAFISTDGKSRGDLIIGKMNIRINKYTTAHFIWEHFKPGDYYVEGADSCNWLRFEVMFKF